MVEPRMPESAATVYNDLGRDYEDAFGHQPEVGATLEHLLTLLPAEANVLDLGSGTGWPVAATIADAGHRLTGYDVSDTMVRLARDRVPAASFERADMRLLDFEPGRWDAVLTFFSMLQIPCQEQDTMLTRLVSWLAPGGYLVMATVPTETDHQAGEWMGHWVQTYSFPRELLRNRLKKADLHIVREKLVQYVPETDQAGPEPQIYFTARKPPVA
ncbi:class I SAM-dependent methyltransferase [Amycolatopsis sp. CA-230715]|uniref:class I SAM-dependent methyltransferase n=1 Tax=Amycolatopsis sp. CA-230715 TaxID=2745196 RepID=UPI001C339A7D|nr:class I SAM-dependent methyltransferase [Amycolatopsis sp. CA-230715]QWF85854.1 Trans-aconitate 2-methyltransferase [Amycolatopsis sp. CA-230715]